MKEFEKMPEGYSPYQRINVCGNKIYDGARIISVDGNIPILVGKGSKPQIWLRALQSPTNKTFISLVEASISQHALVRVEEVGKQIIVKVRGGTVLKVEQTGESQALISELDMRPLGLNVYGDASKLNAGGMSLSNNSFKDGEVFIAFSL